MPTAILIERLQRTAPATAWRVVLWVDVPAPRQRFYAKPATWQSAYRDATVQELADLRAGVLTEKVEVIEVDTDQASAFLTARAAAEVLLGHFQTAVTNLSVWNRYGTRFNGTAWTITNNG